MQNAAEPRLASKKSTALPWQHYLLDSGLAAAGVAGVTGFIYFLHLYPRIPNISMLYLLVVLPLASTRGRYSATLASLLAFCAFDFFIVPPLYTFTMYDADEWIALSVLLVNALVIGNMAAALRQQAREASRREREARSLYHLVRMASDEEEPEGQLRKISQAIVEVFAFLGVQSCTILQPDASGVLQVQASSACLPDQATPSAPESGAREHSFHLIPLKLGQKMVGTLRLYVQGNPRALLAEERLADENAPALSSSFFWTFLGQVTALLERANLQRENLRIAILQRTDTLRAALLSSVSHDLRTPLTTIKAAASSLLQDEVEWSVDVQRGFLQSIEHEADRMNRLVGNLLDMSRIEEGALKPDKDWYSLKALLQDVRGRLDPLLEGRRVSIDLPDDLLMLELDYLEIDQVITNLLENAVRHTPPGTPVEISARLSEQEVVVSVSDHGPGIPTEQLTHVFDKFYRVLQDTPTMSDARGSGLGLAVCKGLVEAHGGRIWATLRPEGGLVVSLALPMGSQERMPV
jgi:two-component system sensor histidine kinase KdpD